MLFRMRGRGGVSSSFLLGIKSREEEREEGPFPISAHMGAGGWRDCERGGKVDWVENVIFMPKKGGIPKERAEEENELVGKLPQR